MSAAASMGTADKFQSGVFSREKSHFKVTVSLEGNITWVKLLGNCGPEEENSCQTVRSDEILAVSAIHMGDTGKSVGFKLNYIKHKNNNILRQAHHSFYGAGDDCQLVVATVQELIDTATLRPRKALVFVNPFSGTKSGVKIYETQVAPIFSRCRLQTTVIVTERANHSEEVLSVLDLSRFDSIVSVGGDGSFHRVASGLLRRLQTEAGVNVDDPDVHLEKLAIPIGLIPGGTGNAVAMTYYGNEDVETAALAIIKGRRRAANVFSVFADGSLLNFSIFLVGYGMIADIAAKAEEHRNLGLKVELMSEKGAKYLLISDFLSNMMCYRQIVAAVLEHVIRRPRVMDMTIEYLQKEAGCDNRIPPERVTIEYLQKMAAEETSTDSLGTNSVDKKTERCTYKDHVGRRHDYPELHGAEDSTTAEQIVSPESFPPRVQTQNVSDPLRQMLAWHQERKDVTSLKATTPDYYGFALGKRSPLELAGILLERPCTRWQRIKFKYRDITFNKTLLKEGLAEYTSLYGFRVKVNQPKNSEVDTGRKHRITLDGDLYIFNEPEFEVRLHTDVLTLFCGTDRIHLFKRAWSPIGSGNNTESPEQHDEEL